jgi:hypothetical protein
MSDLRELTDAELDIVGGGITMNRGCSGTATFGAQPCAIKLVEEVIVDTLRLLEPRQQFQKVTA